MQTVVSPKHTLVNSAMSVFQSIILIGLIAITLYPTDYCWTDADILLSFMIPVFAVVGTTIATLRRSPFQWNRVDGIILLWAIWWLFRVYVGAEYPCGREILQTTMTFFLYWTLRIAFQKVSNGIVYLLLLLLLVAGACESVWGFVQLIIDNSRNPKFLLTGSFQNPGPFSAYPMLGTIAGMVLFKTIIDKESNKAEQGFYLLSQLSQWKRIVVSLLIINFMILPATWSRAAWIGTILIALWIFNKYYAKWKWIVWCGLIAALSGLYLIKKGSADGRIIICAASLTSWLHEPWLGIGYGGFIHSCAEGIAELYHNNPDAFHKFQSAGVTGTNYNALLTILVEQGIVGVILCLTALAFLVYRLYHSCRPLLYCLTALLLFACVSFPFETLPYRIILILITSFGASLQSTNSSKPHKDHDLNTSIRLSPWIAPLLIVGISIPLYNEISHRKECDQEWIELYHNQDSFFIKDYWTLLEKEHDNPIFLMNMSNRLAQNRQWQDCNAILHMGQQVSADPMLYVLEGNNWKELGFNNKAEEAYQKAFFIQPNRLYPLYQLMQLYHDTDQPSKELQVAEKIVTLKPKVQSPATNEMKLKAKEFIESQKKAKLSTSE